MYGMVNRALEDMIVERFGRASWETIRQKSGVGVEVFISNSAYPDETTFALVAAASNILDCSGDQILRDFGRHWVLKTAQEGYGELLNAGGGSLPEFLENLPSFHTRISLIFPHLRPPRFNCLEVTPGSLRLQYYSDRAGFAPFVIGLLEGLGERFATPVRVEQEAASGNGRDYDLFLVEWETALP